MKVKLTMSGRMLIVAGALATGLVAMPLQAQGDPISQAKAAGIVGEQSDGYVGLVGTASADVKAEVDALNIKRRAAYTDLAAKRGATVADVAAATACQTLASRVTTGQRYRITGGGWQTKGPGPIALPAYCPAA